MKQASHAPVMLNEVVSALLPTTGGIYADATFGGGGYARAILSQANCTLFGFDRDPTAIERASDWAAAYGGRLVLINRPFSEMAEALGELGVEQLDGVVFDLGVSSMQLDEAERGFSFMREGPLSMRMDKKKPDATTLISVAEASDLAQIFKAYGEERHARRIAEAIVKARSQHPVETTMQLAEIIARAAPQSRTDRIHPATRVFQAIRIFVNDELGQIAKALTIVERMLRPAGRLVVVTFHSLEDRIVKRFFSSRSGREGGASRHAPQLRTIAPSFKLLSAKAASPTQEEISENPRARSAKLRAGIRTSAPPHDEDLSSFLPSFSFSKALSSAWS
ncbi:MAG: 16S rRNA (cytosine(1402)-N(4))-methyltransferase RsmH [Parvularculaceae bacterium]